MNWTEKDNKLVKEFTLKGFSAIIAKLPEVADAANGMNHHPDFRVYGYKNIRFELSTHSEGKVTEKDHELAEKIDEIFENG